MTTVTLTLAPLSPATLEALKASFAEVPNIPAETLKPHVYPGTVTIQRAQYRGEWELDRTGGAVFTVKAQS
jgi:hypothetical protein